MRERIRTFGQKVKAWRVREGINRMEASKQLGVPYRTLEDWENGNRKPRGIAERAILAEIGI